MAQGDATSLASRGDLSDTDATSLRTLIAQLDQVRDTMVNRLLDAGKPLPPTTPKSPVRNSSNGNRLASAEKPIGAQEISAAEKSAAIQDAHVHHGAEDIGDSEVGDSSMQMD
jgi:hypothetical protein